jgi:hypothetical protein
MLDHSKSISFWVIAITVIVIFIVIAVGVKLVNKKNPKEKR